MTEGKYTNNLNLLLKQQILQQLEETEEERKYQVQNCNQTLKQCLSINETTSKRVYKFYSQKADISQKCEDIKMDMVNLQIEESAEADKFKKLCEHYDLLENLLEHILQHTDCMILEVKSSNRLAQILNTYSIQENLISEQISNYLKKLCDNPEYDVLEEIRTKLFIVLNSYENIKQLKFDHEQKKADFYLAMKNFKIILEVMNINEGSLDKLKQQFDDVLMNYQHSRCILNQEIPFVLAERTKVLAECLELLAIECDVWARHRLELSGLVTNLGRNIRENEYVLVKKEVLATKAIDD